MDNFADKYMKEFSDKLKGFPAFYSRWWMYKELMNNSFDDVKSEDLIFWFFMQSFAEKQVNTLAEALPEKGKKLTDSMKKAVEEAEKTQ